MCRIWGRSIRTRWCMPPCGGWRSWNDISLHFIQFHFKNNSVKLVNSRRVFRVVQLPWFYLFSLRRIWLKIGVFLPSGKLLGVIRINFPLASGEVTPTQDTFFLADNAKSFRMTSNCFADPYSLRIETIDYRAINDLCAFSLFVAAYSHWYRSYKDIIHIWCSAVRFTKRLGYIHTTVV